LVKFEIPVEMKSVYYIIIAFTLAACGYTPKEEPPLPEDVDGLKRLLNEKRLAHQQLSDEVKNLESRIRNLDKNKKIEGKLITSMQVESSTFKHFITVQGNVEADETIGISSETGGRILRLLVKEGGDVGFLLDL